LLVRARRASQRFRKQMDELVSRTKAAESADTANAEFIASMVPQIRTPMNAIVGFVDLALKADPDPALRERLDTVRTSADWLMQIENDALEFSCIETEGLPLENVLFSISECILSAMRIVEHEATAKKLVTACKIDPRLPDMVRGDPSRFRHVIFNLLDYAIKNTASGSIVLSVTTELDAVDSVLVRIAITAAGGRPLISEPFRHRDVTAELQSDPMGFGLVIARRLVDLMGGRMEFRGQPEEGSGFEFAVRFEKQARAADPEASIQAPEVCDLTKLSILVAEDSAVNRRMTTKLLESAGHRVWTATNGKEAVRHFEIEGFDLIFMDVQMPDMDGLEATRAIRASEAPNLRVPIYALTAHALPEDRDACFAAGMDGFLTKPIAANELLELVSKVAAGVAETPAAEVSEQQTEAATSDPVEQTLVSQEEVVADAPAPDVEEIAAEPIAAHADVLEETNLLVSAAATEMKYDFSSIWVAGSEAPVEETFVSQEEAAADASAPDMEETAEPVLVEEAAAHSDVLEEPNLLVSAAATEMNGDFSSCWLAGSEAMDRVFDTAIDIAEEEIGADSNVLEEMNQSVETVSVPAGLALLEAVHQNGSSTPATAPDPFEQARKSLAKSSVGIRAIHNDGDPTDRNLI
ncbi:MAG TPA: response regulator, partial [Bryobacteraceae bacterium]